jgi:transposase
VGRKSIQISFSEADKLELSIRIKASENHVIRQRSKIVHLYSEGYSVKEIAGIMGTNIISVYNWLKRYKQDGIRGLDTKPGQGRPRILEDQHLRIVRAAVEEERQRLSRARQIIEENIGKKMSNETLTRFLKVITAVTDE